MTPEDLKFITREIAANRLLRNQYYLERDCVCTSPRFDRECGYALDLPAISLQEYKDLLLKWQFRHA